MSTELLTQHRHLDEPHSEATRCLGALDAGPSLLGHLRPELPVDPLGPVRCLANTTKRCARVEQCGGCLPERFLVV